MEMVEHPEKFDDQSALNSENMSAAELRKQRRKANKAKAAKNKEKELTQNNHNVVNIRE